jgi:glyoxylase-like metal-dependent hydrolase (beta-lactamase superfamily II)
MPPSDLAAVRWIHGAPNCAESTDPPIQVVAYDDDTFVLRQSMCVNYEAPFMFLLFGGARAALIDTGATASSEYFPLRTVIDNLVTEWLARHPRADYPLLVLHSHSHGDHVAGCFAS